MSMGALQNQGNSEGETFGELRLPNATLLTEVEVTVRATAHVTHDPERSVQMVILK